MWVCVCGHGDLLSVSSHRLSRQGLYPTSSSQSPLPLLCEALSPGCSVVPVYHLTPLVGSLHFIQAYRDWACHFTCFMPNEWHRLAQLFTGVCVWEIVRILISFILRQAKREIGGSNCVTAYVILFLLIVHWSVGDIVTTRCKEILQEARKFEAKPSNWLHYNMITW